MMNLIKLRHSANNILYKNKFLLQSRISSAFFHTNNIQYNNINDESKSNNEKLSQTKDMPSSPSLFPGIAFSGF